MTIEFLDIGLHLNIGPDEYRAARCRRPALSQSIATVLIGRSPAHAWLRHPELGGVWKEPTKAMDHGSIMHALLLGKARNVVLVDAKDWRTNAAKEAREHAWKNGAIPVLKEQLVSANEAAEEIKKRLSREFGIVLNGNSEAVAVWEETADNGSKVLCRAQMDHFIRDSGWIYDLKCGEDAHPDVCTRKLAPMGYTIQRAAYTSAIEKLCPDLRGRSDFDFLFCEVEAPFAVTRVGCAGSHRELGERKWRRAVNLWARCLENNEWPTYTNRRVMAEAKPWELEQEAISTYLEESA